jgi:hypothetical protein
MSAAAPTPLGVLLSVDPRRSRSPRDPAAAAETELIAEAATLVIRCPPGAASRARESCSPGTASHAKTAPVGLPPRLAVPLQAQGPGPGHIGQR